MVGVGIEPTFAAFQTAANPSQLSDLNLMFVEGFEPSASGFVDQRSKVPLSYTNKKSGRQDSNLRRLAPKASGRPLPHTQKNEWNRWDSNPQ